MKLKRISRDIMVLLLFSGLFYVSSVVVGQLEGGQQEEKNDFSVERIKGDQKIRAKQWSSAAEQYRKLTEADPFNGYAWVRLGKSYNEMRLRVSEQMDAEKRLDANSQRIAELEAEFVSLNQQAIEAYSEARQHPRYRAYALFWLAVFYADQADFENSLSCLEEFVDRGFICYYELNRYSYFGESKDGVKSRLHQYDKFWELVTKHSETKSARSRR